MVHPEDGLIGFDYAGESFLKHIYESLAAYVKRRHPSKIFAAECGRLNKHDPKSESGSFDIKSLQVMWKYATLAWLNGWPSVDTGPGLEPVSDSDSQDPHELPLSAVKNVGDGKYRFRSYTVEATCGEEARQLLNARFADEQCHTNQARRLGKRAKREELLATRWSASETGDAARRPGPVFYLKPPRKSKSFTDVFQGRLVVDGHRHTFIEEQTGFEVTVEKDAGLRSAESVCNEKLYCAMRAIHAKARRTSAKQQKQQCIDTQMPRKTTDLEVKRREPTGHLLYAFNNFEIPVTPRKLRELPGEDPSSLVAARYREPTPERALRKLTEKIKRSLTKSSRGQHEAIVARCASNKDARPAKSDDVDLPQKSALDQLDDPTALDNMQEYFEFLASARLLHCKVCDEEWPVFDKEWPKVGVRTAGALAGKCETIEKAQFLQDSRKEDCCSRCAQKQGAYSKKYSKENLQHLGPRHTEISALTWYEELLLARVHPVISVVTLLATGQLCFAGHVCNYYVKVFEWLRELPNILRGKNWFCVRRRKSLVKPTAKTREKKPTTANYERLHAAVSKLRITMKNIYTDDVLVNDPVMRTKFPPGEEIDMEEEQLSQEQRQGDLAGELNVERRLFATWIDVAVEKQAEDCAAYPCAEALYAYVCEAQREDFRGSVSGDTAFELCYREAYLKDVPATENPMMGTQHITVLLYHLMEDKKLIPPDIKLRIQDGALQDLHDRGKSLEAARDEYDMWIRWIKLRVHEELEAVRDAKDLPTELEVFGGVAEAEEESHQAAAETVATQLRKPCRKERR
jgi:hypothetical protein